MKKITPCLWFNNNADEAVEFYKSIFKDFEVLEESRYPNPMPNNAPETARVMAGKLMTAVIRIFDQEVMLLNAGPEFKFNESFSLVVSVKGQEEVDYYWDKLIANGGEESQCGWLKDKFGLSWQIVPEEFNELMAGPNAEKVTQAMFTMKKLIIVDLQKAAE